MDAMPRARTANQEQEAARAGRRLGRASVRERASFVRGVSTRLPAITPSGCLLFHLLE